MIRTELLTKLGLVGRALADNNLVPVLQCFCFDGTRVTASNDQLTITAPCETADAFAVHGRTLIGLLDASQGDTVDFKVDGYEVVMKAGKSRFKLPFFTQNEFLFQPPENTWDVTEVADLHGLEACLLTSSKDEATQPALTGVWLRNGTLYSTDGDAITKYGPAGVPAAEGKGGYMMPNPFCEAILKLAQALDSTVMIELGSGWAKAVMVDYVVYIRLKEQKDPLDHEAEITKTIKVPFAFSAIPEGLNDALARARVVADPESKPTQLTVEKGKLQLLTDTPLGVVRDVLTSEQDDVMAMVSAELMQRSIALTSHMFIMSNCCIFIDEEANLYILLSNYG